MSREQGNTMLPYLTAGFVGSAHADASVFGGIGVDLRVGSFGFGAQARYQYNAPMQLDSLAATPATKVSASWHTTFEGGIKIFLY